MTREIVVLTLGLALAGCSKPAAPAGPSTAAKTSTAPPASPSAAVTVAPPAPDAALAGAKDLKVLVPRSIDDDSNADGSPGVALATAIGKEVKAARGQKTANRFAIYVDMTTDYGCLCPPFVFSPFYSSEPGVTEKYVMPIFAKGVPDAPTIKQGVYRFAGHFDGRRITGFEWLKLRGEKPRQEDRMGMSEYENEAPVFIVEGWCFEPYEGFRDKDAVAVYYDAVKRMAEEGRFCPGSRFPELPEPSEQEGN